MTPKVRYARSGDISIAYTVFGDGPIDVVFVPGFVSNLNATLDPEQMPVINAWAQRIATFGRLITFDKRGTGLSDRTVDVPGLEVRMDDVRAVMDAAGSERAALIGVSEGGPMSILFAATFPDRVTSLTLAGSFATFVRTDDTPWMPTIEQRQATNVLIGEHWGTGNILRSFGPPDEQADAEIERLAALEMGGASPGAVVRLMEMDMSIDVRAVLPAISVPTLVVHATGDNIVPFASGEYLARNIPGARFLPLDFDAHMGAVASGPIVDWLDDFEEFVTGVRPVAYVERVLSTVLYTDIVGSTERAASVGDAAWKQLLDRHDRLVGREIDRHRGITVKSTGDGVLARFDGPGRAVACARAIGDDVARLGVQVRAGAHTGEVELRGDDIGGIAVHIASRVAGLAGPGEVLVSRTVKDLTAGSGISFEDRGEHTLKGVADPWQLFAAVS
jgi:class 3 adenylate cyclase